MSKNKMKSLTFSIKEQSIGWLEWEQADSSVNLLSLSFIEDLSFVLNQIEQIRPKALILVSKKPKGFCAGANITEIQKMKTKKEIESVLNKVHNLFFRLERLSCLKVVAIQGTCLGGGLELALCFDYRLIADSPAQIGLPEVQLGLIPGFGGCLRLPRLIGLKQSLNMILTGKKIDSRQAHKIGLMDERVPALVLEKRALEFAKETIKENKKISNQKSYKKQKAYLFLLEKNFKRMFCFLAKRQVLKKTKNFYPAPLKALEVIQKTYGLLISNTTLEIEKEAFCEISQTSESKKLIQVFKMMDKAKKISPSQSQKIIKRVGILGAGTMGRAIAYTFADKGFEVRLIDINEQNLCKSLSWTKKLWEQQKQKQKINSYELIQKRNKLSVSTSSYGFSTLDLVIEALPENQQLKKNVIKDISKKLNPQCLFASNSSSLCISDLAQASLHPKNFFGLHFFNPAHKMLLTEVILTEEQKELYLNPLQQVLKRIGKIPILVKDSPGFIVNRLLVSYLTEALFLYEEGCEIEHIDHCYRDKFGFSLGPFQLMDKIGLDICVEVISNFKKSGLNIDTTQWTHQLTEILGLGEKSGQGFYNYNNKKPTLNEKTKNLKRNPTTPHILDEIILQRGLYRMLNEGKKLLEEKIVKSEEDLDLALILGMGFPPFLGGLINYAKPIGFSKIKKQMEEFSKKYGQRFKACF